MDKIEKAQDIISKACPELVENRVVYEAILSFYSDDALMETQTADLSELLSGKRVEAYKASAESFEKCMSNLLGEHPEFFEARGMLRYYETSPDFNWQECEKAEIAFGNAMNYGNYGWKPDSWTVFKTSEKEALPTLTLVVAY
jgi:hypothetical protein